MQFDMQHSVVRGRVVSGLGNFGSWISKLRDHYYRKINKWLYPGTLNVILQSEYHLPANPIRLEANEYGGRVCVNIVPCIFFGRLAFLLRTDENENGKGDHPKKLIEIASDVNLRDTYNLKDGSHVEVVLAEH